MNLKKRVLITIRDENSMTKKIIKSGLDITYHLVYQFGGDWYKRITGEVFYSSKQPKGTVIVLSSQRSL